MIFFSIKRQHYSCVHFYGYISKITVTRSIHLNVSSVHPSDFIFRDKRKSKGIMLFEKEDHPLSNYKIQPERICHFYLQNIKDTLNAFEFRMSSSRMADLTKLEKLSQEKSQGKSLKTYLIWSS